ncbi:RBP11-like subunits of RNA polymerase [Piedraia hortae CBS 480.64]|uniref:RBP11-like subunits of RNA polymerase n=1 Tax=Piedraia hortae CBS 480.64 TaxID=1314780 RepID=A0A6A7C3G2_9PEZI|nr:RBP11-like subunits of RNA polymerase [Piedraia hortae CBS 480.64]
MEDVAAAADATTAAAAALPKKQNLRLLPGSTETAASWEFAKESHTLGNALNYVVSKNPDVQFSAYTIPHPSENVMNLRIQTYGQADGVSAASVLRKGLADLQELCDVVEDKFKAAAKV